MASGDEVRARQYRRLIEGLGEEIGRPRGWKQKVAERIGISPSHLSKIMAEERGVGRDLAERAAERLGIHPSYFERDVYYLDLKRGVSTLPSVRERAQELLQNAVKRKGVAVADAVELATAIVSLDLVREAEELLRLARDFPEWEDEIRERGLQLAVRIREPGWRSIGDA